MIVIAQSMVEYGAGGGFIGGLERAFGTAYRSVSTSITDHTVVWIVAACLLGYWVVRR